MSETTMPAIEAEVVDSSESEQQSYEIAFHILPTVAEGEVQGVFEKIKALVTKDHGVIFDEEAPLRFELAYEIVKKQEDKNRKYTSAYFGWIRFKTEATAIAVLLEEMDSKPEILRYMTIKLSKTEEENPFRFHEAIESFKMITTINEANVVDGEVVLEEVATHDVVAEEKVEPVVA